MKSNLLLETIKDIASSKHTQDQIVFIGSQETGYSCTWDEFSVLANREYNPGYGGQEVAHDLIIVFKDGGQLQRMEYDGSEWWGYQAPFVMPPVLKPIQSLFPRYGGLGSEE